MEIDVLIISDSKTFAEDAELRFTIRAICDHYPDIRKMIVVGRKPEFATPDIVYIPFKPYAGLTRQQNNELRTVRAQDRVKLLPDTLCIENGQIILTPVLVSGFTQAAHCLMLSKKTLTPGVIDILKALYPEKTKYEISDMNPTEIDKIKSWLDSDRPWTEGLVLFVNNSRNAALKRMFLQKGDNSYNRPKLVRELEKISGYVLPLKHLSKEELTEKLRQAVPVQGSVPVKVVTDPPAGTKPEPMVRSKELTNSLLKKGWDQLTDSEKSYFYENQEYFEEKRAILLKNGDLHVEIQALHAKMRGLPEGEEFNPQRAELLAEIESLEEEWDAGWEKIDWFEKPSANTDTGSITGTDTTPAPEESPLRIKERILNLRTNISRTTTKLDAKGETHKQAGVWKEKIEEWKKELSQLEASLEVHQ